MWVFENEGLVKGPIGNDNFFIEYLANHLSRNNVDKKKEPTIEWCKEFREGRDAVQNIDDCNKSSTEINLIAGNYIYPSTMKF